VQKKVYFDFDTGSALTFFITAGIGGSKVKISEPGMD
jgi:opacity protein-like surface antigen